MRIGLVIEQFHPERGGAEQWTWQFAGRLLELGHDVHVVANHFSPATDAMPIVRHALGKAGTRMDFAAAAEARLRAISLDVIHDMGSGWYCDVFHPHGGSRRAAIRQSLLLVPRWMRPIKRAVDAVLPRRRQFEAMSARQYVDDGRIVLALSRRVAADLAKLDGVRPEQIRLVYNGVDTERFSPEHRQTHREAIRGSLGVLPDATLLLIVAHNFRLKGVPMLLRAVAACDDPRPIHLAVVGGRHLSRYERAARRLGIAQRVSFVGAVDDTVPYYAAADVYVHPTFYDPCSLGVLEAAASGLPSVTSRYNGAGELLAEGLDGYLMDDPADGREFARCLRPLLCPATRAAMGAAARRMALEHTFRHNCDEIIGVYHEVARRHRCAA
ncbi:MAG: glycosyltransferase family 4 protein [Planctomycetia bacterium]|nr:glycosyltransferase family 4 protein [Planctomycetia bacterium]